MNAITHDPGMSAYNYVERRMSPLSKALTGVLFPYDSFGNHLDSDRKTVDIEMEKSNFRKAGNILADIRSQLILDGHPVVAEYVENDASQPDDYNEAWVSKH